MLQQLLHDIGQIPGVSAQAMTIHHEGERVAAVVLVGCIWDDAGCLQLNAGNDQG